MLILHNLFSVIVLPRSQDEIKCDAKGFFVNLGIAKLPFSPFFQKFYQLLPEICFCNFANVSMQNVHGTFCFRSKCWP